MTHQTPLATPADAVRAAAVSSGLVSGRHMELSAEWIQAGNVALIVAAV